MPTPIKAVLFDYGVVLSGPPDPAAWRSMLAITGLAEAEFHAAYWSPRHDYDSGFLTGTAYWTTVGEAAGLALSAQQIERLLDADNTLWTQVNQPMVNWALRLQAAGTPTGILSNLGDAMADGVLARQPWLAGFSFLLWSHALKMAKPEPAIYRHAAAGLGFPPEEILFIDDRLDNVQGGIAAGMQVIFYTTQPVFEAEIDSRGLGALWQTGSLESPGR